MKFATIFLVSLCSALTGCGTSGSLAQTPDPPVETVTITDRQVIEGDGSYNAFPSVAEAANGDLVLAYQKGPKTGLETLIILRRSSDNGLTWSPEQIAFDTSVPDPTLALMPDGQLMLELVKLDANSSLGAAWSLSLDNGNTWGAFQFFSNPAAGTYALSTRFITVNGDVYASSYSTLEDGSSDAALWESSDSGSTWMQQSTIRQAGDAGINETGIVRFATGNFLAISRDDLNTHTWGHISPDAGLHWGSQIDYTPQVGVLQLPQLLPTQQALLLFGRQADAAVYPHEMVVYASYDQGLTFGQRTVLDTYTGLGIDGGYCWPLLRADGSILVVYFADTNNLQRPDIKSLVLHWGKTHA